MMRHISKHRKSFALFVIIIILVVIIKVPIFRVVNNNERDYFKTIIESSIRKNVYLLKYEYTTGSGWIVVDSNNDALISDEIILCNVFDPRCLRDNREFDLDYTAMMVVESSEAKYESIDEEKTPVLFADKITILYDTNKLYYSIADMSAEGIIKSILGIFNRKYRLSY